MTNFGKWIFHFFFFASGWPQPIRLAISLVETRLSFQTADVQPAVAWLQW